MSDKIKSTTVKKIMDYLRYKTEEKLSQKEIAERMKVSLRQVERYAKQTQSVIFTDEYKKDATLKFLKIWLKRLKDAEVDYNNNIRKIDRETGEEFIDNQARVQFSKVYNDTIKEAERYLSKIGILDTEKSVIEHKLNYDEEFIKESIAKAIKSDVVEDNTD